MKTGDYSLRKKCLCLILSVTRSKLFTELIDTKVSLVVLYVVLISIHSVYFQTMDISGHVIFVVE